MYEIVSLVVLWFAVGLNIYAAVVNFRGYQRNKKIYKDLQEYYEHLTNSEK